MVDPRELSILDAVMIGSGEFIADHASPIHRL
jgi:hypothetical protein